MVSCRSDHEISMGVGNNSFDMSGTCYVKNHELLTHCHITVNCTSLYNHDDSN